MDEDGFHTLSFTAEIPEGEGLSYIFNNGGNGAQTIDLSISAAEVRTGKVERWIVPTTEYVDDDLSNIRYYCDVFTAPGYVAKSPVVDGTSVTFRYRGADASSVKVWGSMNNWASGYTMKEDSYGVWSTTITNVTPGNHSYKFTVDGNWVTDPYNHLYETESNGNRNSVFMVLDPDAVDDNKVTVKIHYTRSDYTNWNCWIWTLKQAADQYDFVQENGERVATVEVVGRDTQYVSFIPRKSVGENKWAAQEFGERKIFLSDIVSGTVHFYITEGNYDGTMVLGSDVIKENKISSVELDYTNNKIIVTTNRVVSCDPMDAFKIVDTTSSSSTVAITSVEENGTTYTLSVNKTLDLVNLYKYKINFLDQKSYTNYPYDIQFTNVYATDKFANEFTYTGGDLGATWTSTKTTFKLWAPSAASVQVALYRSGTHGTNDRISTLTMTKGSKGVWTATKTGNQNGVYYTYLVTVNGKTVETCDPYARTTGVNGLRSMIIDLDSTDPEGWENDTNPNPITSYTDAIIYELHVRDFSIDDSSGVSAANRGKYLALTETGTNYNGVTTGLDYMKELGVTHLHLLPVYDYASVDETTCDTFNWGYDPQNYNVPEGSYSTDPYKGEVRVKEFKQMVKSLHDNDISAIMDVVYNHVYDAGKFPFNMVVPNYFSRQNPDGSFSNGSGCGNDTASEREMVRDYIVSSVMYWKEEYHIDGFRFDLVGLLDATTVNQIVDTVHAKYPDVIFYGEGWTMGTAVEPGNIMATQANSAHTPEFGYFSDTMRNLLAGSNGSSTGFVSGASGKESDLANSFMARPGWTSNPQQIVQYASCHDNYTLMDKLVLSTGKSKIDSDLMKMSKLTGAIYLMSQGVPFIHAGEEFFREKIEEDGTRCENSYNAPDSVNHIEWSVLANSEYAAASDYYQGLIEFRKAHSALRLSTADAVYNNVYCNKAESKAAMFTINGGVNGEIADKIIVLYNANNYNYTFYLPSGTWKVCVDANNAGTEVLYTASGNVTLPGISAMVLVMGDTGATHTHNYVNGTCSGCGAKDPNYVEPSDPATVDYYLIGYINGANYGCEEDYQNLGQYKFVDGKLTATFSEDSYVFLKTGDNANWYMTKAYTEATSATFYNTTTGSSEKMLIPGDVEVTFTLTANTDGTLTLSYTTNGGTTDPSEPVVPDDGSYYLFGYINAADYGTGDDYATLGDYKFDANGTLTCTFPSDSYVGVKSGDNSKWYMTNGWYGAITSATLYDSDVYALGSNADKLLVPGGVELTFTLKVNSDNTVTLSYVRHNDPGVKDTSGIQNGVTLHCWNWSYANIEANMATIAAMGYTAIQTSPAQVMKEATVGKPSSDNWWVFYQPVDFKMNTATDNALGTKAEFESMCKAADKYGIKVIVDVVANHLGNQSGNDLSNKIPSYLRNNAAFWHDYTVNTTNYKDRYDITQHCMAGLPDLNTGNTELQGYVLAYLKECIDAGADGFRFDATKHIETPEDDASFASDFWPNVVGGAEAYAKETYGIDLYCYGELLDNPGGDKLPIIAYTKHLAVTENSWSNALRVDIASGSSGYNVKGYHKAALPSQMVVWSESHDTYSTSESGLNSAGTSITNVNKAWALVAARKDTMPLYFVRPASFTTAGTKLGDASLNTGWAFDEVKAVNKFHHAFVGQSEYAANEGSIAYVERGTSGVVLVNAAGTTATVRVTAHNIANGTYTDQVSGNTFTVSGGKITGKIGSTGIAVVYNATEEHTHSYTAKVTAPTCTEAGYTTYTCSCGDNYIADQVPAKGHSYVDGTCGTCGAADPDYTEPTQPTEPAEVTAYLAGSMNGWSTTANPLSGDGTTVSTTMTLAAGEYTFKIVCDGAWYGNNGTIEDTTTATSAIGWEMSDTADNCILKATGGSYTFTFNTETKFLVITHVPAAAPTGKVEPKSATLSLEDEVLINLYFIVEEMEVTPENVGMLIYNEKPETPNVATADTVMEGGLYNPANGRYLVSTPGIPGQYLADTLYLVAYAKDANGNYVYARTVEYSGKKYCNSQMTKGTPELKATCVALMNYGAAAQEYFAATTDYTYDTLMNADFAQYQNLVVEYSEDLLAPRGTVDATKAGSLGTKVNGFTKRSVSMSADGDFSLNYYLTTDKAVDKVTFYYWTADQYNSVDTLTLRNASGSKEMVLTDGTNRYWANVSGIAAKDIDKTVYACGVYEVNGVTYSSGVFSYSIGYYCTSKAAGTDETVKPFAKAIAVYSYHARIFLESLN